MKAYCCECESETSFDESGYCNKCGGHYDNVTRKYIDHVNYLSPNISDEAYDKYVELYKMFSTNFDKKF